MSYNLIPFGLCATTGKLLDISEVERGIKCNCICPSCDTPLVARQANITWHFAHGSRKVYKKTKQKCDYSFFVSIRMMARQVIGSEISLKVPSYTETIKQINKSTGRNDSLEFKITNEGEVKLTDIAIEETYHGVAVDFIGSIGRYQIVVYLSHHGRDVPEELLEMPGEQCGILEISLNGVGQLFSGIKKGGESFKSLLRNYIIENSVSKTWLGHPRYQKCLSEAQKQLVGLQLQKTVEHREMEALGLSPQNVRERTLQDLKKITVVFECISCNISWRGYDQGINNCPNCETHLYRRIVTNGHSC